MDTDIDKEQMNESLKLITNALNKACTNGTYNIDEAYLIKIALNNLNKLLEFMKNK